MKKCMGAHILSFIILGTNAPATEGQRTLCQTGNGETRETRNCGQAEAEIKSANLEVVDRWGALSHGSRAWVVKSSGLADNVSRSAGLHHLRGSDI